MVKNYRLNIENTYRKMKNAPQHGAVLQEKGIYHMPYKSARQRSWAHTPAGTKALGGAEKVKEWDEATKGKKLPEHVKPKVRRKK